MTQLARNSTANMNIAIAASRNVSCCCTRSRCSANSTDASSRRVRTRPSNDAPRRAAEPRRLRGADCSLSPMSIARLPATCLATAHQQPGDQADRGGDPDRLPRVLVDIVIGCLGGILGAVHRLALQFLQLELRRQQARLGLRAQVAGLLAGLVRCLVEKVLGFVDNARELIDDLIACLFDGHGLLPPGDT